MKLTDKEQLRLEYAEKRCNEVWDWICSHSFTDRNYENKVREYHSLMVTITRLRGEKLSAGVILRGDYIQAGTLIY